MIIHIVDFISPKEIRKVQEHEKVNNFYEKLNNFAEIKSDPTPDKTIKKFGIIDNYWLLLLAKMILPVQSIYPKAAIHF